MTWVYNRYLESFLLSIRALCFTECRIDTTVESTHPCSHRWIVTAVPSRIRIEPRPAQHFCSKVRIFVACVEQSGTYKDRPGELGVGVKRLREGPQLEYRQRANWVLRKWRNDRGRFVERGQGRRGYWKRRGWVGLIWHNTI